MEKEKDKIKGPMPRGNVDFADPPTQEEYNKFSQDIYDLMSRYRINNINMYWKHFESTEKTQSLIKTIN